MSVCTILLFGRCQQYFFSAIQERFRFWAIGKYLIIQYSCEADYFLNHYDYKACPYLIVRVFRNIFSCRCCYICSSYVIDDNLVCLTGLQRVSCDVFCLGKQTARQKRQVALYQVIDRQLHKVKAYY